MKKFISLWAAILCTPVFLFAQSIPNSGFESWSNPNGYNVPEGWSTFNDITSNLSIYTCTKGTPGSPGASYIKLTSKSVPGLGVVSGLAVSGDANLSGDQIIAGFPCIVQPTALTGKWQYMGATSSDIGFISVVFTKWDADMNMRDTIGEGMVNLNGMVMNWANFNIPVSFETTELPDSCTIQMSSSGSNPVADSYLYVDNLNFSGVIVGVEDLTLKDEVSLFPNPCTDALTVALEASISESNPKISMLDEAGKTVWISNCPISDKVIIPTKHLPSGVYFLRIISDKKIIHSKIIKS
jgi:hypothetical protein